MLLDVAIQKSVLYSDFVEKEIVLLFMYLCSFIVLSKYCGPEDKQLRNSFASNHDSWEFKITGKSILTVSKQFPLLPYSLWLPAKIKYLNSEIKRRELLYLGNSCKRN